MYLLLTKGSAQKCGTVVGRHRSDKLICNKDIAHIYTYDYLYVKYGNNYKKISVSANDYYNYPEGHKYCIDVANDVSIFVFITAIIAYMVNFLFICAGLFYVSSFVWFKVLG